MIEGDVELAICAAHALVRLAIQSMLLEAERHTLASSGGCRGRCAVVVSNLKLHAGVTKFLSPSVAGFLLQKELDYLDGAVKEPKRPFVAIVGGSKVSSKIGVIESLIEKVDKIILG